MAKQLATVRLAPEVKEAVCLYAQTEYLSFSLAVEKLIRKGLVTAAREGSAEGSSLARHTTHP